MERTSAVVGTPLLQPVARERSERSSNADGHDRPHFSSSSATPFTHRLCRAGSFFIGSFAGIVLTFQAGAEVDLDAAAPRMEGVRLDRARLVLRSVRHSSGSSPTTVSTGLAARPRSVGLALSTTSLAVSTPCSWKQASTANSWGNGSMSATFVTDIATVTGLTVLFIKPTIWIVPFVSRLRSRSSSGCPRGAPCFFLAVRRPRDRARVLSIVGAISLCGGSWRAPSPRRRSAGGQSSRVRASARRAVRRRRRAPGRNRRRRASCGRSSPAAAAARSSRRTPHSSESLTGFFSSSNPARPKAETTSAPSTSCSLHPLSSNTPRPIARMRPSWSHVTRPVVGAG